MDLFFLIHPVGTVLSYVFYWIAVIGTLVYLKFSEVSFLFLRQKENIFLSVHSFHHQKRVAPPWPVYNQPQPKRGTIEELKKPLNKTRRRMNMKTTVLTPYRGEVDELMITILFFHSHFSKYTR